MSLSTTVGAILCAAHRDRLGRVHGHTWTVWASFEEEEIGRRGAGVLKKRLEGVVNAWDHSELPDELSSGEGLARAIAQLLGDASRVRVERLPEMIVAEWAR